MPQSTICIKIWLCMHPRNFGCVISSVHAYVVVNFLSQVIFVFLLFLRIVMYSKEVETKEKEELLEIKN